MLPAIYIAAISFMVGKWGKCPDVLLLWIIYLTQLLEFFTAALPSDQQSSNFSLGNYYLE
jgi:hypothetical protein